MILREINDKLLSMDKDTLYKVADRMAGFKADRRFNKDRLVESIFSEIADRASSNNTNLRLIKVKLEEMVVNSVLDMTDDEPELGVDWEYGNDGSHIPLTGKAHRKKEADELERGIKERETRQKQYEIESEKLTPEYLDKIAKSLQTDAMAFSPTYDQAFEVKFIGHLFGILDLLDDGKDLIMLAKLGDQVCRMFEKLRDNCETSAEKLKDQRRGLERANLNLEIDQGQLDRIDEKLNDLRRQWAVWNNMFVLALRKFRPHAISQSCMQNWGSYTQLKDMPRVIRMQKRKEKLNSDNLLNDRAHFDYNLNAINDEQMDRQHEQERIIDITELPEGDA